jgi:short-subunit dehydrogenase
MRLEEKQVLITGASSGIGRALAVACARRGARLILTGRNEGALEETRGLLPTTCDVTLVAADIATPEGRRRIRQTATSQGPLDVLINNAGVVLSGRIEDNDDAALARVFETNVLAPIALTRDLMAPLRRAPAPRIVNVGSVFGDIGHPMFSAYAASKFALRGFSDSLRRELAGEGIGVLYAAPRATRTGATAAFAHLVVPFGMAVDDADTAAAQIVRAIERDRAHAYARGPERFFVLVQRLLPFLVDRALARKQAKYIRSAATLPRAP